MEGQPGWDLLSRMSEKFAQRTLLVKQFKSIFSGFDILPKRLKQARSLPLVSVSFSRRDVPVSLFFFRRNCFEKEEPEKLYSKAATTPDSLHSTRITVFRGFQTWKSWIWSILKYFQTWKARIWSISKYSQTWKSTIWSILKLQMWGICQQTENLHRKIHISTNAAILHSWIILSFFVTMRNVEKFTLFHSRATPFLCRNKQPKNNFWQGIAFRFTSAEILGFWRSNIPPPWTYSPFIHFEKYSPLDLSTFDFLVQLWNPVNLSPMLHPLTFHCTY